VEAPDPSRFIYISDGPDGKLERLWEKFPPPWWRRLLDQIVSVGIFMVSIGRSRPETSRMQKLRWVQHRLEQSGQIGSVDEPKQYFFGRIAMHHSAFTEFDPPVVYLIGETDQTIVALGGSLHHAPGKGDVKPQEGAQPHLSEVVVARAVRRAQIEGSHRRVITGALYDPTHFKENPLLKDDAEYNRDPSDDQWAVDVAETLWRWPTGLPQVTFETLAEREEFTGTPAEIASRTHKNILVGSPVYVTRV
jgi:hypothetical protein